MESVIAKRNLVRKKRALRVRGKIFGSSEKPRLTVYKSNKNLFVQLIDDESGKTLVSYGTQSKDFSADIKGKNKVAAKIVGERLAKLASEKGIKFAVFDRGRFKYHGVLAELAQASREHGLQF
ncbi:MAG: 50S ribosomal protein L18 [Rhabdochlamydiaceae bacterium]